MNTNIKLIFILLITFFIFFQKSFAQELNCQISVVADKIQTSDRNIFTDIQTAANEFLNNRKWSGYRFSSEERIECSFFINITDRPSASQFKGSIQIQVRRPVFNSTYNTTLLNYIDKDFEFEFQKGQPLEFNENSFYSNLTSVLAYYVYLSLGIYFDAASLYGGTPFYDKAQTIINNAQNAPYPGWKSFESQKNRYWIIANMLNKSYEDYRNAIYTYHRLGLDQMYDNQESGRSNVYKALQSLELVHRQKPGLIIMTMFFLTKSDELPNIFSQGTPTMRADAQKICNLLDPTNGNKYKKMTEGN